MDNGSLKKHPGAAGWYLSILFCLFLSILQSSNHSLRVCRLQPLQKPSNKSGYRVTLATPAAARTSARNTQLQIHTDSYHPPEGLIYSPSWFQQQKQTNKHKNNPGGHDLCWCDSLAWTDLSLFLIASDCVSVNSLNMSQLLLFTASCWLTIKKKEALSLTSPVVFATMSSFVLWTMTLWWPNIQQILAWNNSCNFELKRLLLELRGSKTWKKYFYGYYFVFDFPLLSNASERQTILWSRFLPVCVSWLHSILFS